MLLHVHVFRVVNGYIQQQSRIKLLSPDALFKFERKMVQLHVKRGDESLFLFTTTVDATLETVIQQITAIYNRRLKVDRICSGENDIKSYTLYTLCKDEKLEYEHTHTFCFTTVLFKLDNEIQLA